MADSIKKAKGVLQIMGRSGHVEKAWDEEKNPGSFEDAQKALLSYTEQGYVAFEHKGDGKGERIRELKPEHEKVVLAPMAVVG